MSTTIRTIFRVSALSACLALATGFAAVPAAAADGADAEAAGRSASSRQIERGGRDGAAGASVRHSYGELQTTGKRDSGATAAAKAGDAAASKGSDDFWFYDADVKLFNDDDRDGYYHGIDLLFDADTIYEAADVYAVVYLSLEGGPWNEYAVTSDFTLYGATSDDEYVIVTELESGYPAGSYDLLIELYDAVDGSFLAEFGPVDTSALSFLPLEDFQRDAPIVEEVVVVGHRHGGGGAAFGLIGLALPALLLTLLRQSNAVRRRRSA